MSRLLAAGGSRREAVKAALAVALGGATVAVDPAGARSALCRPAGRYCTSNRQCCNRKCRTGKRVPIASRNICDCDAPFGMCGKMCRDLSSDVHHCGTCGNRIDRETHRCCDGVATAIDADNCAACGDVCGPDDTCCGTAGGCVDLRVDAGNCGACGTVCETGECVDGACAVCLSDGGACTKGGQCCSLNCEGGVCMAPSVDCSTVTEGDYCYRIVGASAGVVGSFDDLICGGSADTSWAGETCTSNADCQAYIDADGLTNLRGLCLEEVWLSYLGVFAEVLSLVPTPSACVMVYTEGATCPPG